VTLFVYLSHKSVLTAVLFNKTVEKMIGDVTINSYRATGGEDAFNFEQNLLRWHQAIRYFYSLQATLVNIINKERGMKGAEPSARRFVGQCSLSQLVALEAGMTQQLEHLLCDMDLPDHADHMDTLRMHTALLQDWNSRIKRVLCLTSLPAC
jgi:hypothetical protein